ncbi:MAG: T9SS type A sorting domain-containing protein [Bacteroidia bacterium]
MKTIIPRIHSFVLPALLIFILLPGRTLSLSAQSDYKLAEQDSLALVAFYWATDGPNWISNQAGFGFNDLSSEWQAKYDGSFNPWLSGPAKDWFGVRVEKRAIPNSLDSTYRVTWIWPVIGRRTDGQNQLNGYLPREVGLLTALEQLLINGNDGFTWELIPDDLYHPSLQYLDIESCWFGGGLSDQFRNCTDIRKMNLRYNNLDYMPNWDFLDEDALRNLDGTQWLYNSRFSFAILEKIITYFYSISPNPQEFRMEMRDMFDVGDELEVVAPLGSSVVLDCNDAGQQTSFITYQWFKDGLSRFGQTQKTYTIPSVSAGDYGDYKVRITNDYVKTYDLNTNYGEVFTKEIHLVEQPVPPVIENATTAYNGQYIELYFSKPMAASALAAYQDLRIAADGDTIAVLGAELQGRLNKQVRIQLDSPLKFGQSITLLLAGASNIEDHNGGLLQSSSPFSVANRVRQAPTIIAAKTTLDGFGIILDFDDYMDSESLAGSAFAITGNTNYQVVNVSLSPGEIDAHISKTVLLTLDLAIEDTAEVISMAYLSGNISGLYSGTTEAGDTLSVLNQISTDRSRVTLIFEDGSEALENLFVQGSWKIAPQKMFDDGQNGGDAIANDHVWTYTSQLAASDYSWNVFEREEITAYDSVQTVDPITGVVTITLIPKIINQDSTLSENIILAFSVADQQVSGDTVFGIYNRDVIFNVNTFNGNDDVYLMGINDDWNVGRQMLELDPGLFYTDTVIKLTAGDIIEYNYRIGSDWENPTPEPRTYVVKNGPNIIENTFGIFTGLALPALVPLSIYPNPNSGNFSVKGTEQISTLELYNMSGQLMQTILPKGENQIYIKLSKPAAGLYFVKATSHDGRLRTQKILIKK